MEAVPRMPMLSFELKQSPEFVEFGPTLKQYIRDHYGEDPAHYNKSCNELEQLRQSAVHVSHDFMGCSMLKKYYAQLQFLQGRFPMTELGEASMPFTWEDVHSGREVAHNDIKFEQACILYNIGCLHSLLGALDTRQSADGMKVSCTHFQCATWAYEHLRDHYGSSGMSLDMSHELLTFQSALMLAQAQECILEKSMADSRKSSITAKVSAQIVEFYNTALKSLTVCNSEELISSKQFKDWKKKIDIKVLFYDCITNYYMGQQSQEQQKWGQCLAYFTQSLNKLEECEKLAKSEQSDVQETLRFTRDVVQGKHQAAKKDNDFVYHEKVPGFETLPEVKGAPLVKGIPFNVNDPEISGPDIFIKLVPMSAHEASSLYSEEKANLLRRMASEMVEKNDELNQYLASLQLDQTELNPEPERLPQQLLEKCAAISVRPNAIKDLVDSMTSVSNVATEVDLGIQEIQQMLQEESKAELEFQELFGKRAPNIILSEIAKECAKFEEGHKKGSQSNTDLHKAMNTHISNLKLLSSPLEDIQTLLPSVDKERGPESADVIKELNMLMNKVEEMRAQRDTLEQSLRKEIMEDDITGTLAKHEGVNRDVVFAEQLKKHDKNCTLIRQNLAAQGNILRALTNANAKYANVRRATRDTIVRRDQVIRDLINSYDIYEDLMAKSQKGLEFYNKLEANVKKLMSRCRGVCKVQQEEREQMMNRFKPKPQAPSRPTADKPPPSSSIGQDAGLPPLASVPSVTPMFDGPKLKDYLPFMKPNTFGKKAGSPDLSKADPAVQSYFSKTGSLPNSGTASPVHVPNISGSVPGSPDHFRQSKFNPQLQGLNEGYPSLQDLPDGQGQQGHGYPSLTRHPPQGQTQGHPGFGAPPTCQVPMDQRMGSPSRGSSQSPSPQQPVQYPDPRLQGVDPNSFNQSQFGTSMGAADQYVPLNEKWKREAQSKGRVPRAVLPNQGQIPNPQGQAIGQSSNAGSQLHPSGPVQPGAPMSQQQTQPGVQMNPQQFSQAGLNQQLNQPGVDPRVPNIHPNMQYQVPNQQNKVYGQQNMVGYREVTNTVSTIDTPVISPNKHGQAKVDQYGQVIGGHRHLQGGAGQMPNVSGIPISHTVAQQPGISTTSEQYWQQQMQQQQDRLGQRNFPHEIPQVSQTSLPSQVQNVQGQMMPVEGHSQGLQSQSLSQQNVHGQQGQYVPSQGGQGQPIAQSQNVTNMPKQFQNNPQLMTGMGFQQPGMSQPIQTNQQYVPTGLPQQNEVPGKVLPNQPMPSGSISQGQPISQFGQIQQPMGQQLPHSQQTMTAMQPPVSGQLPVASQQQLPQQAYNTQTHYGQQGVQQQQIPQGSQQQNYQKPQIPNQVQQIGQQVTSVLPPQHQQQQIQPQQYPQHLQQNQQVSSNQQLQSNQTGLMSQSQQVQNQPTFQQNPQGVGSLSQNQANVLQRPTGSGSPHQIYTGSQTSQFQPVNSGFSQPGPVQPPTQYYSPSHRPQQSQTPLSGVHPNPGNTPQNMVPTQQPVHQAGLGPASLQSQSYTQNQQGQQYPQQGHSGQTHQPVGQGHVNGSQPHGQPFQGHSGQTNVPGGQGQVLGSQPQSQSFKGHSGQTIVPGGQVLGSQAQSQSFQGQTGQIVQPRGQGLQQQGQQLPGQPQQQGIQYSVQGQTLGSQGQMQPASSQAMGQHQTYQGQQPGQQLPNQGQPTQQFHPVPVSQPPQIMQGQGQISQRFQAPSQQIQPAVSSAVIGGMPVQPVGQRFSAPGMAPSPIHQGQPYPVQSQGHTVGSSHSQVISNLGQPQSQPFQGVGSNVTPSVPAPAYSDTALNRQATAQMMQVQQNVPVPQGIQQLPNVGQGRTFQGQINQQPYMHSNVPGQHVQPTHQQNSQTNQVRGQNPGIAGPVIGQGVQGQLQGQNIPPMTQQMPFPGQQPPLQPQVLQPTVVHKPKGQPEGQGHQEDKGQVQSQTNINTNEVSLVSPAAVPNQPVPPPTNTSRQTSVSHVGPLDSSRDFQQVRGEGQSEGHPIPASRQLSTASSLDEILSSSPDTRDRVDTVLAPKVLTAQEIQQQKEDQLKNSNIGVQSKDPYKDKTKLDKFVIEVEKFAKFIEGYKKPSCSGPTPLDSVFKEVMEEQEKAGRKQTLAIARCYPMKNRDQDIMPFDDSRVLISSLKDDYINASWINDVSPSCPKFIATQWPLPVTLVDFWITIYEQGVEVIAALSSEIETGKKFPVYLPEVKGETISHGPVQLTLQSVKQKPFWTERILHLRHSETKSGRTLVHLHYSTWPVSGFPEKVSYLLQFITEVHSFYRQQRSLLKPIVVHCSNGVGRTGIFLLIYMGMMEVNHGQGIVNLPEVAGKMLWKRRNLIHKKDQLKYCYDAILYYAQDILAKQGILVHKASFGDQLPKPGVKSQSWEPGEDILFGSMSFSNLQTNIARLGTKLETNRLDQRLEMLKSGEKLENTVDHSKGEMKSSSGTVLPDLVQLSPGRSLETNSRDTESVEKTPEISSDPLDMLLDGFQTNFGIGDSPTPVISADIKSTMDTFSSPHPSPSHSSHESSSSPQVSKKFDEPVSSSLTQLQDPTTFTIGTGDINKKKKITKADFLDENKKEEVLDPDDPLSSLDPFWSVKK